MTPPDRSQSEFPQPEPTAEPPPRSAAEHPVVAALLLAYRAGVFPMAAPGEEDAVTDAEPSAQPGTRPIAREVWWFDPDPRGVIPLEGPWDPPPVTPGLGGLRVTRSLRQRVRSGRFRVTTDAAFGRVIRACALPRRGQDPEEAGWIDDRLIAWYEALHAAGHAHSVEAWLDPDPIPDPDRDPARHPTADGSDAPVLVGGLYGVAVGGLFAGESMFSRPDLGGTDASKVCLVHLVAHLIARGFVLLDTQFGTEHLARLGGVEIPRETYHERLAHAASLDPRWEPFTPGRSL